MFSVVIGKGPKAGFIWQVVIKMANIRYAVFTFQVRFITGMRNMANGDSVFVFVRRNIVNFYADIHTYALTEDCYSYNFIIGQRYLQ